MSAVLLGAQAARAQERPNVVLIMVDDMGFSDLGVTGSEIDTPNLDRLAEEGTLFTQFYNAAKCEITRGSLMTGLYAHQIADSTGGWGAPTVLAEKHDDNATIAELLGSAGYETILSGKWHLGPWTEVDLDQGPIDRGFDHFFGHLSGAIDFFTGVATVGYYDIWEGESPHPIDDDFYATDAFTDYAIERVTAATGTEDPFFLYLSYNAPHFPLQVPEADIDEYLDRGTYSEGWAPVRQRRYERQRASGIVDPAWNLHPGDTLVPDWERLTRSQQLREEIQMATYAGMVDRLDRQIGRFLERLEELGIEDDTMILFLSDNGGHPFSYYGVEWATVSNTPFGRYKQWQHEGGISTPLIVRWPGVVEAGRVTDTPGHVIDVVPSLLDAAGVSYPDRLAGNELLPLEGESLWPVLEGDTSWAREEPIIHEFDGQRLVRDGDWKLVAERGGPWELYHMGRDRTETENLVEAHPDRAARMIRWYETWAERIGARTSAEAEAMPRNTRPTVTVEGPDLSFD